MCSKEGLKNITPTDREVLTVYEKIRGKTEEEFITYDVFLDCIHPGTGRPLTQKTDSALDRYNTFRNSDIDYDADVSLEANCIYEMVYQDLFAGEGRKTILRQPYDACFNRHGLKYEIGDADGKGRMSFRGDTMNSVATTNRAYLDFCNDKGTVIREDEACWPKEALEFMNMYHTPGNFMLLPYTNRRSINAARGRGSSADYFDLFLMAVYNFFCTQEGTGVEKEITLSYIFGTERLVGTFFADYLMRFTEVDLRNTSRRIIYGWEAFVRINLLQDFVESKDGCFGRPKELWKGHFDACNRGLVRPQTTDQFKAYWRNASEMIRRRGARIYRAIQDHYHSYFKLQIQ